MKAIFFCFSLLTFINWKRIKLLFISGILFLWSILWQYGVWSFQTGDAKLERFLHKNQHTKRKLLNFEFWINGELSKSAKSLTFKVNFLLSKIIRIFLNYFSLKNTNLGVHFLLLTFFIKSIFK